MSTSVGERSHLERNKSEGGASTSRNVPAGSASGPPNAAGPLSPPVLGKCCYGVLAYSRKHYDAGLEPSCVGVKVSSDHLNPPRGDQGEAWGNFRYSCMGYSVYRATRGHKDGAVDLPSCEFGVEILATATSNDEKQDRAATGARAAVERPGRDGIEQRGPSSVPKRAPASSMPISVGLDDFPQKWLSVSKRMASKMAQNLEYSRKAVVTALSGKWGDDNPRGGSKRP